MKRPHPALIFLTSFSYPSIHAHPIHGRDMARAWTRILGHRFLLVIEGVRDDNALTGINHERAFGLWGPIIRIFHMRTAAYGLWLLVLLLRTPAPLRPIMFVNDVRIGLVAAVLRSVFQFTLVYESHGIYPDLSERLIYARADRVVFVTRALYERAAMLFGRIRSCGSVIPNAVDVESFDAVTSQRGELRSELHLPEGILVGYVGRFRPGGIEKGVEFLIDTLSSIPEPVRLVLVGGTDMEIEVMRNRARGLGVERRIVFVPFVDDRLVPMYCKACDILAYVPVDVFSRFQQIETSPMKLFEYMAARRPIVVSDTPAVREILDESCAFLCKPDSADSFRSCVAAAGHAGEVDRRVSEAYRRVVSNTWLERAGRIAREARIAA